MESLNRLKSSLRKGPPEWVVLYTLSALAFFYFSYLAVQPVITSRWLDFPVYWEAGEKAVAGQSVYTVVGHFQYKYSPLIALLFGKFFHGVSFEAASFFFSKAMLVLWIGLFVHFARRDFRSVAVLILFFGNALRLDLELGQINAVVLFLLAILFSGLERPKSWRDDLPFAFLFSLTIQLKLFALVLIPLLILQREWRKLILGLLFLPLLSIGGVAFVHGLPFALAENHAWLSSLRESTDELLASPQNVAVLGTLARIFGLTAGKILWFLSGLGFTAYLWQNRMRSVEWFRDWLLYGVTLFNPLVWSYWILYAVPMVANRVPEYEGIFQRRSIGARTVGAIAAIFIFLAFNGQHARWAWMGGIFAALVFVGLTTSRVRTRA